MCIVETKSNLIFVVQDIKIFCKITAHAKRLLPYPTLWKIQQTFKELRQEETYYETTMQTVDHIKGVRKQKGKYEVLVAWLGYERCDDTWEPIGAMIEDVPGIVEDYRYSAPKRNLKHEILDL